MMRLLKLAANQCQMLFNTSDLQAAAGNIHIIDSKHDYREALTHPFFVITVGRFVCSHFAKSIRCVSLIN